MLLWHRHSSDLRLSSSGDYVEEQRVCQLFLVISGVCVKVIEMSVTNPRVLLNTLRSWRKLR